MLFLKFDKLLHLTLGELSRLDAPVQTVPKDVGISVLFLGPVVLALSLAEAGASLTWLVSMHELLPVFRVENGAHLKALHLLAHPREIIKVKIAFSLIVEKGEYCIDLLLTQSSPDTLDASPELVLVNLGTLASREASKHLLK